MYKAKPVGNSQYMKYISGIRLELNLIYYSKTNVKGLGPDFRVELTGLA